MPTASDLNSRIALAKGWTRIGKLLPLPNQCNYYSEWRDPTGRVGFRPDFVGTLEGVSGMMRELQEEQDRRDDARQYLTDPRLIWSWRYLPLKKKHLCALEGGIHRSRYSGFMSADDRPGDCVGKARLSVFGKKAADASSE